MGWPVERAIPLPTSRAATLDEIKDLNVQLGRIHTRLVDLTRHACDLDRECLQAIKCGHPPSPEASMWGG